MINTFGGKIKFKIVNLSIIGSIFLIILSWILNILLFQGLTTNLRLVFNLRFILLNIISFLFYYYFFNLIFKTKKKIFSTIIIIGFMIHSHILRSF